MKKILSLALATLMLATVFASCAPAEQLDPAITLASSDAAVYAEWLDERLDKIPDDVVIGVGSNEAYGINMSNFESDGYVLREIDGDVLIFGASKDGLDRAVRKYAQRADINQTANLDEVYHEGPRITKLTVGGRDISEYTAVYTDAHTQKAAQYLQSFLLQAAGVTIALSDTAVDGPVFEFAWITDETLNTAGFTYTVTEGKVLFECSDEREAASAQAAVYRFIENELDWFGLTTTTAAFLLSEGEVDIPAGTAVTEANVFHELTLNDTSDNPMLYEKRITFSYHNIVHGCHGIANNKIAMEFSNNGEWNIATQPCYMDEAFQDACVRDITAIIENNLAAGRVIGEDFFCVDIAAGDNDNFCTCSLCLKISKEQGNAVSASVVDWANRVSSTIAENERFRGVVYQIFAYVSTVKPPRNLAPNEYVYITIAPDWNCALHPYDGNKCTTGDPVDQPYAESRSNRVMSRHTRQWLDLTENVYIWTYNYGDTLMSISYIHTVYEDFKFYRDIGMKGIYWNSYDQGFGANYICRFLWSELQWNGDITDEEFSELYDRALQCFFGEGWENVKEYFALQEEIYLASRCSSCWFWGANMSPTINADKYDEKYDTMYELLEEALYLADSAIQECRINSLQCNNIYKGSIASYFSAYDAYDDERCDVLIERYGTMYDRMIQYGVDITKKNWATIFAADVYTDLELQMWANGYVTQYAGRWLYESADREMPEHVKEYIESVSAEEATATE